MVGLILNKNWFVFDLVEQYGLILAKYGKTACYVVNNKKKYTVYSVCGIVHVLLIQRVFGCLHGLL